MVIYCPNCDQEYIVPEEYYGCKVECENCGYKFILNPKKEEKNIDISNNIINNTVKLNLPTKTRPKIEIEKTKTCPFCAEIIMYDAVKCRYCGEYLDGRKSEITSNTIQIEEKKSHVIIESTSKKYKAVCLVFVLILIVGVILFIYSTLNFNYFTHLISVLLIIIGLVGTAITRFLR